MMPQEQSNYEGYREQPSPPINQDVPYYPLQSEKMLPQSRRQEVPIGARVAVAIVSLGVLIPLSAIALSNGLLALVLICLTIVMINVALNWQPWR